MLLPDIDIFWYRINSKIDHRGFTHYPLLYFVISVIFSFFADIKIIVLFFTTTIFHCIHDTFILGWSVPWFAPFSYRRFKISPDNGKGGFLKEKYLSWLPDQQKNLKKIWMIKTG